MASNLNVLFLQNTKSCQGAKLQQRPAFPIAETLSSWCVGPGSAVHPGAPNKVKRRVKQRRQRRLKGLQNAKETEMCSQVFSVCKQFWTRLGEQGRDVLEELGTEHGMHPRSWRAVEDQISPFQQFSLRANASSLEDIATRVEAIASRFLLLLGWRPLLLYRFNTIDTSTSLNEA